jgi:hypothetical protein
MDCIGKLKLIVMKGCKKTKQFECTQKNLIARSTTSNELLLRRLNITSAMPRIAIPQAFLVLPEIPVTLAVKVHKLQLPVESAWLFPEYPLQICKHSIRHQSKASLYSV